MAQQTVVNLIDDLDGTKASETISFAFNGNGYEIDLNSGNAKKLEKALKPFIECARVTQKARSRRVSANGHSAGHIPAAAGRKPAARKRVGEYGVDNTAVRAWAEENDINCPAKGRVPRAVVEAYRAAGNK